MIRESDKMTFEVLKHFNIMCVRCSVFMILFAFIWARSAEFAQEPMDVAMARNYPMLGTPFLTLSLVQCAAACLSSPFCAMFLHSLALSNCTLFGVSNQTTIAYSYDGITQWHSYVYKSDCKYMYVRALNGCWKITNDLFTMASSRSTCQDLGGDMIQARSLEEFDFLRASLSSTSTWYAQSYWIGATKTSNDFTWLDTRLVIDSNMWGKGQPDSFGSLYEDCVNVMPIFAFRMNDMNCSEINAVVCSIPVTQASGK